jgi:hypothetical protein
MHYFFLKFLCTPPIEIAAISNTSIKRTIDIAAKVLGVYMILVYDIIINDL